jgi:hypothetical protein
MTLVKVLEHQTLLAESNSRINGDLKSTIKVDNGNVVSKETLNLTTNVANTIGVNLPTKQPQISRKNSSR